MTKYDSLLPGAFVLGLLATTFVALGAVPTYVDGQVMPSLAPMLERAMPAVVNISTRSEIRIRQHPLLQDPFFRHFFQIPNQPRKRQSQALGSGVIIDRKAGYVLTNNHVIDKADEILVTLRDGRQLAATMVGTDPDSDIAVIRIPAKGLIELPIANSENLKVGDFAVAIGNPFGLGQTVTSGIISALGRSGLGIEGYEDFIQTDASINPGNSGGALVNLRGELIGINTAIIAPSGGNVGIGFAIPSNMAIRLKESLIKHGEVRRGLLGVTVQDLTPELAQAFAIDSKRGALISRIQSDSPAERAGLEPGDIIIGINGRPVKDSGNVRNAVGLLQIGEQVNLTIVHNGAKLTRTATIAKPAYNELDARVIHPTLAGVELSKTLNNKATGVLIEKIDASSYAWAVGLRPGDIIAVANKYRIRNVEELKKVARGQRSLLLNVRRGGDAFLVLLQ